MNAESDSITREEILDRLIFNPETGIFSSKKTGARVGHIKKRGYVSIYVKGHMCAAHRLAWVVLNNEWPPSNIDHINGNRSDNREKNLRLASDSQNQHNRKRNSTNKSGIKGVFWNAKMGKFYGQICTNRKNESIGAFDTIEEAAAAMSEARVRIHGEFANNG